MLICGDECSGCGVCMNTCPKNCIDYLYDDYDNKVANINVEQCINCNMCRKVCPIINDVEGNNSIHCYASWSLDDEIRRTSASGGIATELYRLAEKCGMWITGVTMGNDFYCYYSLTKSNFGQYCNSKYTYSDPGYIYRQIRQKLVNNEKVLFIGLPCHVAALKNYVKLYNLNKDLLILVDLVCHGVTPQDYLKSHIEYISKRKKKKVTEVYFRDPDSYTYTYTFTLKNNGKPFYQKKVHRNDTYQIGYHRGIIYRDNCYRCKFAKKERQGDISLSDFAGVGIHKKCNYDNKNVSCVLINTTKGKIFFNKLIETGFIYAEERPIDEEYDTEPRLHSPTPVPEERKVFKSMYANYHQFEVSMKKATKKIIVLNEMKYIFKIDKIKILIAKLLPTRLKNYIKQLVERLK